MPMVAQSQVILSSCTLNNDEYSSSKGGTERGIGKHVVALEFAHESPPYQFTLPLPFNDDGVDAQLTIPETTEASSVPQNMQVKRSQLQLYI